MNKSAQRQDAIDVLGEEYAELIDEIEAVIRATVKGKGHTIVLKSRPAPADFWAQLITEGKKGLL